MGPSCGLKLASSVLHNAETLCIALLWDMIQYSLVETVFFFETLVATYQSTLRHSPLDNDVNIHRCKDLKLCITDQQLNSILKNSCFQSPQTYTTTSSPPQLLVYRQPHPQP
jgi:predicted transcriptional regulator